MAVRWANPEQLRSSLAGRISRLMELIPAQDTDKVIQVKDNQSKPRPINEAIP